MSDMCKIHYRHWQNDCHECERDKLTIAQGPVEWQDKISDLSSRLARANKLQTLTQDNQTRWMQLCGKGRFCPQCNDWLNDPDPSLGSACGTCHSPVEYKRLALMKGEIIQLRESLKAHHDTIKWIASQSDLFFAECCQAEEIVSRCQKLLEPDKPKCKP